MVKSLITLAAALWAAAALAAVDVNRATEAQLDAVKGIGPAMSGRILAERKKAPFKDWQDLVERVKGIGPGSAARFSAEGLTVNGDPFKPAATSR
ncbi:helix-hairpin-helix domain-containing protein [Acidovorax sp. FG27]|uniref:ComEA family DNA-binding protein n=1 Tax=Acidovorax sp. FG27 TaxID=3133652 RepID=UPI0030E7C78F